MATSSLRNIRSEKIRLLDRRYRFDIILFIFLLLLGVWGYFDYTGMWPEQFYVNFLAHVDVIKSTSDLILFLTLLGIVFYATETYRLRNQTYRLAEDARKRTDLEKMAFLRLQWSDKTRPEVKKYIGEMNADISTSLVLVNDGRGVARNVEIKPINIAGAVVHLKNVTAIKGSHGFTQLRYMENSWRLLDKEQYNNQFTMEVDYEDYDGFARSTKFYLDSRYNDGFRIE